MINTALEMEKRLLRKELRLRRRKPSPKQNHLIRDSILTLIVSLKKNVIASAYPLYHEVDLNPCNLWLFHSGYHILLPKVSKLGESLCFHQWMPSSRLYKGHFATLFPKTAIRQPEIILVPILGFDKKGNRIGYGGGYYDRTLAYFKNAIPIGYALSSQQCDNLPKESHDVPLPYIVTEEEILIFQNLL